jgi:hypothetical protein
LGGDVHTVQKNTEALVVASKEIGLEVNAAKTKYMFMSRDLIAGQNHNIKSDNKSSERLKPFECFGTTLTDQNSVQNEIMSKLKTENACYHSVQNHLPSRLIKKNIKIMIYSNIILPLVLYGCETRPLTMREEEKQKVFENRVLRRIFGAKRDKVTG